MTKFRNTKCGHQGMNKIFKVVDGIYKHIYFLKLIPV